MEINGILKYQAIDLELSRLKKELQSNENCKIAEETKRQFNEMKAVVVNSENVAKKVNGGYEESLKHYDETLKTAESLIEKLGAEDLAEEDAMEIINQLEAVKARLVEITDYLEKIKKRGENAVNEYTTAQKSGKELKDKYTSASKELEKLREEYRPRIEALKKELAEAKRDIPPEIMARYEKVASEAGVPAFVEAYVSDGKPVNCSTCGHGLSLNTQQEIKDKGYCVCDNCHRIIYVKK